MTTAVVNLYDAKKDGIFHLASLPDVGLLESLGLRVGTRVTIQSRYALGGPVLLRVEDAFAVAVGKDIAEQIAVKEAGA